MKISLVIPAHNEEGTIVKTIEEIESRLNLDYEIVVVNDHSNDGTAKLVENLRDKYRNIRSVNNQKEGCFGNALRTGFEYARGDFVVPIMADLCDEISSINLMLDKASEGYDIICGSRYMPGGKKNGGPILKSIFSRFYGMTLNFFIGIPTNDIANAFKMYNRRMLESLEINSKNFAISVEIPLKAHFKGFKITQVPTVWRDRTRGESKFNIGKVGSEYIKLYFKAIFKKIN